MRLRIGCVIWIVILAAIPLALVIADSRLSEVAPATVLDKREQVDDGVVTDLTWKRTYQILARYEREAAVDANEVWIGVDREAYDRLTAGDAVNVRYLRILPDVARLAEDSLATLSLRGMSHRLSMLATAILIAGMILLWHRRGWLTTEQFPRFGVVPLLLVLLWSQAMAVSILGVPRVSRAGGEQIAATAQVGRVTTITELRSGGRSRSKSSPLPLPSEVERVELRFTPDSRSDPVLAVDEINRGSAGTLETGQTVRISYPASDPREGRLESASRGHRWVNGVFFHAGSIGLTVMGILLARYTMRARQARRG